MTDKYRVWCDPEFAKWETESDAIEIEAESARCAAEKFAERRYSELQHIDPGVFLVRSPLGQLYRFDVHVAISFVSKAMPLPTEESGK